MNIVCVTSTFMAVLLCIPFASGRENALTPDLAKIDDAKVWSVINGYASTDMEDGKRVVQLRPKGQALTPSDIGLALIEGLEFTEGVIDIDLKGKGRIQRSFLGIAFAVEDGKTFEAVYFRPFNFLNDGVFRKRAVQYVAWPEHTWEKLRAQTPGVYESAVNPIPDPEGWFHARIEVTKKRVKVFVNDGKEPCLVVDRLASRDKAKVGLWVDSQEGRFANLKILSAK
jgi:hypothetical protein